MIANHQDRLTKLVFNPNQSIINQAKSVLETRKEDWPGDGKTTSTSTYDQTDPTDAATISRAT